MNTAPIVQAGQRCKPLNGFYCLPSEDVMGVPWPADKIERRRVEELIPYARNARTHSDAQIEEIARSIEEWGWTMPVLVDERGLIVAGHGRVLAAARLGLVEVPVMVARGWTAEQVKAYRIADNKIASNAGWDETLVALELSDLEELGFDVTKLGYTKGELVHEDGASLPIREVATGPVKDEFWISIKGDLAHQAEALARMEKAIEGLPGVRVMLGTAELE